MKTFLVEFEGDDDLDPSDNEVNFDTPIRFRGSRENDTHYTIVELVPTLFKEVSYEVYYGGSWRKIVKLGALKKDINSQFIVHITGTDVPGSFELTSDWLRDIIDAEMPYDNSITVSVKPFGG